MYVFFGAGKSRSANKIKLFCFEDGLYVAKGRRNGGLNNDLAVPERVYQLRRVAEMAV